MEKYHLQNSILNKAACSLKLKQYFHGLPKNTKKCILFRLCIRIDTHRNIIRFFVKSNGIRLYLEPKDMQFALKIIGKY